MLLQSVIDASDNPIFSLDEAGRYTCFNRSHAQWLRATYGVDPELGRSLLDLLPIPEDSATLRSYLERAVQGEAFVERMLARNQALEQRWLDLNFRPMRDEAGHVTGVAVFSYDVTVHRGREASLERERERAEDLESIVNHSRSVVMRWRVDTDYPIEYITRNVDQFGFDADELMGCNAYWTDRLHPDDAADFEDRLNAALAADLDEYVLEYRLIDRDNRVRWVTDRSHAFRDQAGRITGYVSIIVDITERMQRELELELLASTAAVLSQAATRAEIRQAVLHAVCRALETDTAGICSAHYDLGVLVMDDGCGEWAVGRGRTLSLERGIPARVLEARQPYTTEAAPADANAVYVETLQKTPALACVPLLVADAVIGVLAAGRTRPFSAADVRLLATLADMAANALDRVGVLETLELRVAERTQDLLEANHNLERLAQHKDEFLATMSHELRTPLTAVLGLSEAIDTGVYGELNSRQQRAVQIILQSGRHLLHLINDLLDLSRIEAGHLELQLEPCHIEMVCHSCMNLVAELAKAKRQHLRLVITPPSLMLMADTRRLHQLLLNLLSNATKFTPDGGTIDLRVTGDDEAHQVLIEVADTGIGIPQEDQSRIFEPFVQLDSRLARQYTGSGLGLALVQRIAAMHGGSIEVYSAPEQGSRFVVTLPWRTELAQAD